MAAWVTRMAQALALASMAVFGFEAASAQMQPPQIPPPVPNPAPEAQASPETRIIALKHHWTREELKIAYRIGDAYQPDAMAAIDRLMRDYRCNKTTAIDPKLVDLLYELHQELGGQGFIRVVSAYRSEGYNASLLRAGRSVDPDSQHTLGRAADVIFPGVKADRLRAAAEAKGLGGVGFYPFSGPIFVHVDTGPVRHWTETDPRMRRAAAASAMPRRRFVLDCDLTLEKVFADIPAARAYAALPPGASAKPHPEADVLRIALAAQALKPSGAARGRAMPISIQERDGPACLVSEPLTKLSSMEGKSAVAQAVLPDSEARKPRLAAQRKSKVAAQVRHAKRAAGKTKVTKARRAPVGKAKIADLRKGPARGGARKRKS